MVSANDTAFDRFLKDQVNAETPTILQKNEQPRLTTDGKETQQAGFLDETIISGENLPRFKRQNKKSSNNPWLLIGGGLLGIIALLWAAGVFLKVETPEGTIIIDIDQPELAGAVVSVDGEKKVTITTGEKNESITLEADGKTHSLKVVKGGFKAFVKEFTIKAGGEQTIKVRLEPVSVMANNAPPAAEPLAPNYALEFDGKTSYVKLPVLDFDLRKPFTFEAVAQAYRKAAPRINTIILGHIGLNLGYVSTLEVENRLSFFRPEGDTQNRVLSDAPISLNQMTHVAGVWDGQRLNLYVNGKKQGSGRIVENPTDLHRLFSIGAGIDYNLGPIHFFNGIIDEVRISNIARYTKDYTPTTHLKADEDTLALYHFDKGTGDILYDSSGNGQDGKIIGAKWVKVETPAISTKSSED